MKSCFLIIALIFISSCSPDALRPNCIGKRAYAKVVFPQNPFINGMDMHSVGYVLKSSPKEPEVIGKDKTLVAIRYETHVVRHNYMVNIDHVQDRKTRKNEYVVNIFINPKEYYTCSYPVGFIVSDLNQVIYKIPLKPEHKEKLYDAIDVKTIESKKLSLY